MSQSVSREGKVVTPSPVPVMATEADKCVYMLPHKENEENEK